MATKTPNPAGRTGKPIIVPNMNLDAALRKILSAPPPEKHDKATKKKVAKSKK